MKISKNIVLILAIGLPVSIPVLPMKRKVAESDSEAQGGSKRQKTSDTPKADTSQNGTNGQVQIRTSDQKIVALDPSVAVMSLTIKNMIEALGYDAVIECQYIESKTLLTIIDCLKIIKCYGSINSIKHYLLDALSLEELCKLINAVNFLDIPGLVTFCLEKCASLLTSPQALATFIDNTAEHPLFNENLSIPEELKCEMAKIINEKYYPVKTLFEKISEHQLSIIASENGVAFEDGKDDSNPGRIYFRQNYKYLKTPNGNEDWKIITDTSFGVFYIKKLRYSSAREIRRTDRNFEQVISFGCFSPDGNLCAYAPSTTFKEKIVLLYNTKYGSFIGKHKLPLDYDVAKICFSPDGNTLGILNDHYAANFISLNISCANYLSKFDVNPTLSEIIFMLALMDDEVNKNGLPTLNDTLLKIFNGFPKEVQTALYPAPAPTHHYLPAALSERCNIQ